MKFTYFVPLLSFIIPTVVISSILFVIDTPPPLQLGGFVVLPAAACVTYYLGIRIVREDLQQAAAAGDNSTAGLN